MTVIDSYIPMCADPDVADHRASALTEHPDRNAEWAQSLWYSGGQKVLRFYLLAAALTGADASLLDRWLGTADQTAFTILRKHADQVPSGWIRELDELLELPYCVQFFAAAQRALHAVREDTQSS